MNARSLRRGRTLAALTALTVLAGAATALLPMTAAQAADPLTVFTGVGNYASYQEPYHARIVVSGGLAPYSTSITAGSLPNGLSLEPAEPAIVGTPSGPLGDSTFTVTVRDSGSPQQVVTAEMTVNVGRGTAYLTGQSFPLSLKPLSLTLTTVTATLTNYATGAGIADQLIRFESKGLALCSARTNGAGKASCSINLATAVRVTLNGVVGGHFDMTDLWSASSFQAYLLVGPPEPPL